MNDSLHIQPPPIRSWAGGTGTPCALHGAEAQCPAPALKPTGTCEVCSCTGDARLEPHWMGENCSSTFMAALQLAWCFLVENLDLVQWSVCRVLGPEWVGCLSWALTTGRNPQLADIDIRCDQLADANTVVQTWAWPAPWGPEIIWNTRSTNVQAWGGIIDCSRLPEERMCAVIDLAAVLLHELAHACGAGADTGIFAGACPRARLLGHTARWAFLMRFPTALAAACCQANYDTNSRVGFVDAGEFMNPQPTAALSGCRSTC